MKRLNFILLSLFTPFLNASSVNIPNNFTAGTPARAAEVNENFSAIESAINDNDVRITANENAINSLNASKQYLYPVNVYSVNTAGYPNLRMNSSGMYNTTDLTDIVAAPVVLPDGATITDMHCLVRDTHNTANFSGGHITLMRVSMLEGAPPSVYQVLSEIDLDTSGNLNGLRRLNDNDGVIENAVIDNNEYMYSVRFWIQRTSAVSNLMVSGCRIDYEL